MTDELKSRQGQALEELFKLDRVMSLMAALAAPRCLARLSADERAKLTSKRALEMLDDYLRMVEASKSGKFQDPAGNLERTEESTRTVRALLEEWDSSNSAFDALVDAARAYFKAFGSPEPDGGWAHWDGSEDP